MCCISYQVNIFQECMISIYLVYILMMIWTNVDNKIFYCSHNSFCMLKKPGVATGKLRSLYIQDEKIDKGKKPCLWLFLTTSLMEWNSIMHRNGDIIMSVVCVTPSRKYVNMHRFFFLHSVRFVIQLLST